ncbi:MAG: SUF system NifU family Fe-S cluster assembly protein [Trueperaceae bacterium]
MSLLDSLYKEIILDHYKRPRNRGVLDPHTVRHEGLNPSCGDELELFLLVEGGTVKDVSFVGEGCAISQASASMMTKALKGLSLAEAQALADDFKAMIHGQPPADKLGDLKLLQGISKLHARVKCATLPWVTLVEALESPEVAGRDQTGTSYDEPADKRAD